MTRTRILASISLAAVLALLPAALTFADGPVTDDTIFRVSITDFLTLTVDQTDNIAQINALTRFNTGSVVASVATNNALGYTLTFEDADERNGLERSGYSSASVEDKPLYNIPSVVSATTYANLTDDTYGYFLGSTTATEATYLPVPLTSTEIDSSDEPTAPAASTTINFGVKISATRPSGTYEDTVVISAVVNMGNISFDDSYSAASKSRDNTSGKYKLHEMTPSICEAVTTDQTGELVDIRDGTVYHVGKLKDNRCWLLDNLALDPTQSAVKANMTDINTNASAAAITNYKEGGNISGYAGWATEAVSTESSTSVDNQPRINSASKNTIPSDTLSTEGVWKVGTYYNYCAASIGTYCYDSWSNVDTNPTSAIDADQDVCPANWRMPTGGYYDASTAPDGGEFDVLYYAYENDYYDFRSAFRLPFSGKFDNGAYSRQASYVGVWSSTYSSDINDDMYALMGDNADISQTDSDNRYIGYSVRCIAKTGTEPAPNPTPVDPDPSTTTFDEAYAAANKSKDATTGKYVMQDMTTSICNAVTTPTQADNSDTQETLLVDNRDNKLYWVAKLKDGHCWMTQNLDLDLESVPTNVSALTHANTDLGWTDNNPSTTWTPEQSTILATNASSSWTNSWTNSWSSPYSVDVGDWYWDGSGTSWYDGYNGNNSCYDSTTGDYICNYLSDSGSHRHFYQSPIGSSGMHGHVGNYYNWVAISGHEADSVYNYSNPPDSICPANWRLPIIYDLDATPYATGEFQELITLYGNNRDDDQDLTASPLYFVRGGAISSGDSWLWYPGSYGYYWSRAVNGDGEAYTLYFDSGSVNPSQDTNADMGLSARCLAR